MFSNINLFSFQYGIIITIQTHWSHTHCYVLIHFLFHSYIKQALCILQQWVKFIHLSSSRCILLPLKLVIFSVCFMKFLKFKLSLYQFPFTVSNNHMPCLLKERSSLSILMSFTVLTLGPLSMQKILFIVWLISLTVLATLSPQLTSPRKATTDPLTA